MTRSKGTIGILTGGGDVPGLNPAIRGVTLRALREGYRVLGIRRGWAGLVDVIPTAGHDNSEHVVELDEQTVNLAARTGGTFLHSSRTRPSHLPKGRLPESLQGKYDEEINDITPDILEHIEFLGLDTLIAIGGDDTLSYAQRLHEEGMKVIAIPKTMDNDVPGTDYCIGFSTCVSRTIELTSTLRTPAGSHERILVIEVFGRYAGFTSLFPTMAGAADRCVIPEYPFEVERLVELLLEDRQRHARHYSIVLVSEGAQLAGDGGMSFEGGEADMFGHRKLGGIGERIGSLIKEISPRLNQGRRVDVINQKLGYLVRGGAPDAIDSIVPMAYGNMALDLILAGKSGRLVNVENGVYGDVPIEIVTGYKKVVDIETHYETSRLRPKYATFAGMPLFIPSHREATEA